MGDQHGGGDHQSKDFGDRLNEELLQLAKAVWLLVAIGAGIVLLTFLYAFLTGAFRGLVPV